MDLTRSSDSKYTEYENHLLERDQLAKEADQIWTAYIQLFGHLMTMNYEEKLECIKCKKTLASYQSALNHGGAVDPDAMQRYLDSEMAEYYAHLDRLMRDRQEADSAGRVSPYEVQRSKELYRRLAKLIHPDINPETDRSDVLRELWQRIMIAYHASNVRELSDLEVLVRRALKELGVEGGQAEISDIGVRIEELRAEIDNIRKTEPYSLRYLVEDKVAAAKKMAELRDELEEYKKYRRELNDIIARLLQSGGLIFNVK